jgi:hypothetical protein
LKNCESSIVVNKPDIKTSLGHAILKYHYDDYANKGKFRTIYHLFSHEAVTKGSIQEFAKGLPKPSRKRAVRSVGADEHQSIDESFLQELDNFREELARAHKRKNPRYLPKSGAKTKSVPLSKLTCTKQYFGELPIHNIDFDNKADKSRYDAMVQLVDQMLEAKKQLASARMERDKTFYENKCARSTAKSISLSMNSMT